MERIDLQTQTKILENSKATEEKIAVRTYSGLNPYNGPWTYNEAAHLLKRTMFGAKPEDVNYFLGMSMNSAVDELLSIPAAPPAPPVKNYTNTNIPTTDADFNIPMGETWVNINSNTGNADSQRRGSFKSWWTGLMINQEKNIREKMTLFWHNHFATESVDLGRAIYAYQNNVLCREFALGNFKRFTKLMTLDVGMLRYLNGYVNINAAPDENFARELQELFTLGNATSPSYSETDVKTAARVLTGWKINTTTNTSYFNSAQHDTQNKTFSSFYNNYTIVGRTGATAGDLELDDLLNMIFRKDVEVSKFLVRKLYRYFVYYKIDSASEANVITPLAQILVTNNWEIKPVLEALFKSEHFFDVLNQGCFIKTPIDLVVGACREFGIVIPDGSDYINAYNMWGYLQNYAALMQQNIGDPPDVAGWKAYYQEPQFHEIWINTDTYPRRNLFTDTMINSGYTRNGVKIVIDPVAFTRRLNNPSDPNALIDQALKILYRIDLTAATKDMLKRQILLSNQVQDYYWTNAWNAYVASPTAANYQVVFTRLRDLYKYFMNLAEFHLC